MKKEFNLEEKIEQYNNKIGQLMYEFASELLDQVADEDVLKLYEDNNKVFSKLSARSKESILQDKELLQDAINILIEHLDKKPITREEYDEMTFDEILSYISDLLNEKEIDLFDYIKFLEDK